MKLFGRITFFSFKDLKALKLLFALLLTGCGHTLPLGSAHHPGSWLTLRTSRISLFLCVCVPRLSQMERDYENTPSGLLDCLLKSLTLWRRKTRMAATNSPTQMVQIPGVSYEVFHSLDGWTRHKRNSRVSLHTSIDLEAEAEDQS